LNCKNRENDLQAGYTFTDFPYITRENETKYLKCTSFILIDEKFGPMIFDTGSMYDAKNLPAFLKTQFGLNPADIKWVFITHIHPDHIGANIIFRNAKLVLSRNEFEFGDRIAEAVFQKKDLLTYLHENCPGYKNSFDQFEADRMEKTLYEKWSKSNIGLDLDVLYIEDSPEIPDYIKIIPTPGHTFYHYSFLIETKEINILVAGDALSMRLILRDNSEERLIEPHMDFPQYFNSLEHIKKFDGLIVPGHDRPFFSKTLRSIRKNNFKTGELLKYKNHDQ
jgi:glyoxylase-like metal-dependent hydrolase (beta-lactamase superfamily II)